MVLAQTLVRHEEMIIAACLIGASLRLIGASLRYGGSMIGASMITSKDTT